MRRAGPPVLGRIAPLLEALRGYAALDERRPGVFYVKSREFLHFHDDAGATVADVRLAAGFERMPVNTESEQADLLARIDDCLYPIEARSSERRRGRRGGR